MTKEKWLTGSDVHSMVRLVRGEPVGFLATLGWRPAAAVQRQPRFRASQRQLRLFAAACCGRIAHLLTDERLRRGIEAVEQYADDSGGREEWRDASAAVEQVYQETCVPYDPARWQPAVEAVWQLVRWEPVEGEYGAAPETMVINMAATAVNRAENRPWRSTTEHQAQCALLRDIVGNPFRPLPPIDPTWLRWREGTIPKLAAAIYTDRHFPDVPILADALEEAGCTDADMLDHLRGPGAHIRGCHVLDLILGRE
jgi:hypothetical protein